MRGLPLVRRMGVLVAVVILAGTWPAVLAQEAESPKSTVLAEDAKSANALEDFIKKSKQPVPWLNWGADLRLREIYDNNDVTLSKDAPGHERHWQRYRMRLWSTLMPTKDVDINVRMVFEPRHYCKPDAVEVWQRQELIFDKLNVELKNLFGLPAKVKLGRQDIKLGDGWLVYEGTPTDGSRTIYFDAARLTVDVKDWKTTFDAIYVDQKSQPDRHLPVICDKDVRVTEQDEHGFILNAANRSLKNTDIDGYYIFKADRDNRRVGTSRDQDIHTFGARVVHRFSDKLKAMVEVAEQLGDREGDDVCAFGANSRLTYSLNDATSNSFRVDYEYASGDDPGSGANEQFDPVWGRWWRLSDLITYAYVRETRYTDPTNFHRTGVGWSCKPHEKLGLNIDYNLFFADQNSLRGTPGFSRHGCFRGHLLATKLTYKFNEHVKGHLTGQLFAPGDYYDDTRNDVALFARYELVFTW